MRPTELNPSDGFILHGWMVTELNLEGAELLTFALVHQFCQSSAGIYTGNTAYLSAWTGWSEKTSRAHLARLVDRGLIRELRGRENNHPFCNYALTPDFYEKHPVDFTGSPGKNFPATRKNLPGQYDNLDIAILVGENNCESNIKKENIKERTSGRFVPPTVDDVRAYCAERQNGIDAEAFVAYYESKGWRIGSAPMKSWKAAVVTWERRRGADYGIGKRSGKESLSDYYRRVMAELAEDYGTDTEQPEQQ